jgi:hypothetical protein
LPDRFVKHPNGPHELVELDNVLARERGYKATKTIEGLLHDARLLERILDAWEDYRDSVASFKAAPPFEMTGSGSTGRGGRRRTTTERRDR